MFTDGLGTAFIAFMVLVAALLAATAGITLGGAV